MEPSSRNSRQRQPERCMKEGASLEGYLTGPRTARDSDPAVMKNLLSHSGDLWFSLGTSGKSLPLLGSFLVC